MSFEKLLFHVATSSRLNVGCLLNASTGDMLADHAANEQMLESDVIP